MISVCLDVDLVLYVGIMQDILPLKVHYITMKTPKFLRMSFMILYICRFNTGVVWMNEDELDGKLVYSSYHFIV